MITTNCPSYLTKPLPPSYFQRQVKNVARTGFKMTQHGFRCCGQTSRPWIMAGFFRAMFVSDTMRPTMSHALPPSRTEHSGGGAKILLAGFFLKFSTFQGKKRRNPKFHLISLSVPSNHGKYLDLKWNQGQVSERESKF